MPAKVTWKQLRELAEKAQGYQHGKLGIRVDNGALIVEDHNPNSEYIAEIDEVKIATKLATLQVELQPAVEIKGLADPVNDITRHADAVFWSVAAVEKFLVPYYSSFKDGCPKDLVDQFKKQDVVAILHLPNSEPTSATAGLFRAVAPPSPPSAAQKPLTLVPIT